MNHDLFNICNIYNEESITLTPLTEEIMLGRIIINRMVGIASHNIEKHKIKTSVAFGNALNYLLKYYKQRTKWYKSNVHYIGEILKNSNFHYALLKGVYLITQLYENGHRTSNDIDILIAPKDISSCQNLLLKNGFIQGEYKHNLGIVPATRREILMSRINFGETVPFVKMINGVDLIVDINFSTDFKPNDTDIVEEMLDNVIDVNYGNIQFKTLNLCDFLIHLCCHLYKEATTYDWLIGKRDLLLYKFHDINLLITRVGGPDYFQKLIRRILELDAVNACYYAFENTSIIYPSINKIEGFINMKQSISPDNIGFMYQIIFPKEKKLYKHSMNFIDWFFCEDRISQLEEIKNETI